MKQKMLKLIKILNRFTINDILTMSDFTEKDTVKILSDFEECSLIKKISETEYIYVERFKPEVINAPQPKQFRNAEFNEPEIKTIEPIELFSSEDELKFFQSLSDNNKKHIVKILTIFKLTDNLHGKDLIKYLKELVYRLTDDKVLSEKDNELEIAGPLKQILKEQNTFFNLIFPDFLSSFMAHMGLSYYNLTKQEKKEILEMEFTFENWKNKTITMSNNYIEKAKKICPLEIQFCLDDPIFIFYVQVDKHQEFKLNNFLSFIRDYYILEESKDILEKFYEPNKFNENRNKIIEEYPKLNKWEKDIIGGEGIQFGGGSKQPAKYLEGYKFLDTKKKHLEKFYVNYQGTTPFHADYLHRNKYNNKEIFEAPALLLKKGNADDFSCISAVSTERLVFTHSISSIKFKDKNIDKLYSLCGILNSDFYTYFLFNTASSVGVERNQVHFAEYLKTPFVCNIELSSIVKNLHNTKLSNKEILLNNLNNKINQIFEINKNEIDLIDYAINISIPIWRFGDNISKTNEPIALKYVTKAQLEEYATIFTETFSEQYKYFNVDIYNFKYCTLINFKAREEKPTEPQICFIKNANLENTLKTISDSTINNISDEVFIKKDVKGFNENSFFVLKTNEYKNWHRAIARLDVNEFSNAIWEAEIELPE